MSEKVVTVGVSAKFECTKNNSVDDFNPDVYVVVFQPVIGGSEENEKFYASTPYGELVLGNVSKKVSDQFEIGKEYYLTLLPAEIITAGFDTSASNTASYMSRNIMQNEDGEVFYGRCDHFKDGADFASEILDQGLAEAVTDPVKIFMRPATPEELKELDVEEWFYEVNSVDRAIDAPRYYKAEAYDPGKE